MADGDMVVGLDLGTTKVCVVIAELTAGDGLRIIGVGHTPSEGLRRSSCRRRENGAGHFESDS